MQAFWDHLSSSYGNAQDLEEKQRMLLASFLSGKTGNLIELACGNGKVIEDILTKNTTLTILGIDYNASMIDEAKKRLPGITFIHGDILEIKSLVGDKKFEYVVCLNSIHNLPSKALIYSFFEAMKGLVTDTGYIIFDIRNIWNPFIRYGYRKNRSKGLDFYCLNKFKVIKLFGKEFTTIMDRGIHYENLAEAGKQQSSFIMQCIYRLYLQLTKINLFAPYQFIILQKK